MLFCPKTRSEFSRFLRQWCFVAFFVVSSRHAHTVWCICIPTSATMPVSIRANSIEITQLDFRLVEHCVHALEYTLHSTKCCFRLVQVHVKTFLNKHTGDCASREATLNFIFRSSYCFWSPTSTLSVWPLLFRTLFRCPVSLCLEDTQSLKEQFPFVVPGVPWNSSSFPPPTEYVISNSFSSRIFCTSVAFFNAAASRRASSSR